MSVYIFASGVAGGLSREVLRWRQLHKNGRTEKFLSPLYFLIAITQVLLCGAAALLFAPLAPFPQFELPVAFVAGAGFELLVKKASCLQLWSPDVAQGGESVGKEVATGSESTREKIIEFLRN